MTIFQSLRRLSPFRVPALGAALPANYDAGEKEFDRRVKEQFPLGMPEIELIRELQRQGFDHLAASHETEDMTFYRRLFPFITLWSVRWRAEEGRVVDIWGVYGVRAP